MQKRQRLMTKAAELPSDFPIKYGYLWTLKEFQNGGLLSQNFYVRFPTSVCVKGCAVDLLELRCHVPRPCRDFRCLFQMCYEQMSDCCSYTL